jgi:hypothetical protein
MNYSEKLKSLQNRRSDPQFVYKSFSADSAMRILNEDYSTINYPESVKYTMGAMAEVDQAYTSNSVKEGLRIQEQLKSIMDEGFAISFRFQGSTTNNTHIKAHSDIDLLVIQERFTFTNKINGSKYEGDWKSEQISLRKSCNTKLSSAYPSAIIDNSGNFSISVSGGSLKRKVDVVPSCWDLNDQYFNDEKEENKGIRVFNKECTEYNTNYPFINNRIISNKDIRCSGNFRKAVRLLKTLKADSSRQLKISSYDIVSLLCHMNDSYYLVGNQHLQLVQNIKNHLLGYCTNYQQFLSLSVPDNTRKISDKTSKEDLNGITVEVGELEKVLIQDLSRIYKSLNENIEIGRRYYK